MTNPRNLDQCPNSDFWSLASFKLIHTCQDNLKIYKMYKENEHKKVELEAQRRACRFFRWSKVDLFNMNTVQKYDKKSPVSGEGLAFLIDMARIQGLKPIRNVNFIFKHKCAQIVVFYLVFFGFPIKFVKFPRNLGSMKYIFLRAYRTYLKKCILPARVCQKNLRNLNPGSQFLIKKILIIIPYCMNIFIQKINFASTINFGSRNFRPNVSSQNKWVIGKFRW